MNLSYRKVFYEHYVSTKTLLTKNMVEQGAHLKHKKPFLIYIIKKHFPQHLNSKIIDLGCGDGALLYFAKQLGYQDIAGYDLSKEQIDLAQKMGLEKVYLKDALQAIIELSNDSCDIIVSFDVLEHLTKDEAVEFSHAVHRALKSNGKWIIHTVNAESPFFGRIRYGDFTHENAFTKESIRQLLNISGFDKVSCHEDAPISHGIKSTIRYLIWKIIRNIYRFFLAAETGEKNGVFSQNFLCVAEKNEY